MERRWIKAPYTGPERRKGTDRRGVGSADGNQTIGHRRSIQAELKPPKRERQVSGHHQAGHAPSGPVFRHTPPTKLPYGDPAGEIKPAPVSERA